MSFFSLLFSSTMEVFFESPGPSSHATSVTITGAGSSEEAVAAAQNRIYAEYGTDRYEMSVSITDSENGHEEAC